MCLSESLKRPFYLADHPLIIKPLSSRIIHLTYTVMLLDLVTFAKTVLDQVCASVPSLCNAKTVDEGGANVARSF